MMGGFSTLFLDPAESPAPWKVVKKPVKGKASGLVRVEIHDAEDLYVAECPTVAVAEAIVWAVNHLAEQDGATVPR